MSFLKRGEYNRLTSYFCRCFM